jgi:PAS domain S-box-containing protein
MAIKILVVEDEAADAIIILNEILKCGIQFEKLIVDTEKNFRSALQNFVPDLIISDYSMPEFDGMNALMIRNELIPQIPFILVTGSVNEEIAVEIMKAGADDYIIKQNLSRLVPAILSSLKKAEIIRSKEDTEKAYRESEEIFSAFMEHSPVYVFFKNDQTRPIRLSKNYENMLGMPVEKAIGKTMDELFPSPLSKTMILDDLRVLEKTLPVKKIEELNGRYYETTKFPIVKQDGSKMLAGFTIDITEKKQAEDSLRDSEERYLSFINANTDLMFVKDDGFRYIIVNEATAKFFGRTKEELLLKTDFDLMDLQGAENCKISDLKAIESGASVTFEEKVGDKVFETTKFPLHLRNEKMGIGAIIRDITQRKKAEEVLIFSKEKAEESDRLKTAFLHNISHEIRTPMNSIVGFSSLLGEESQLSPKLKGYIEIIIKSSNHLLSVVNDIIEISNIEAGILKVDESEINLYDLLSGLFMEFNPKATRKGIILSHKSSLTDNVTAYADRTKLKQVLINLLNNAIKFTEKGRIEFGCKTDDGFLEFYVSDTGIGIKPEYHNLIFDRFYQVDHRTSRQYEGTGLGLSISKAIVEKMGGRLWVTSEPGKGSLFQFRIPFIQAGKKLIIESSDPSEEPKVTPGKKTILVAEDEENNYRLMVELLSPLKAEIIHAVNGKEAVEICESGKEIDLVLMDIKMPVMDGYTAIAEIKKILPDLNIIALTAYAFESDREKAVTCGCSEYLSKPVGRSILIKTVSKYL